MEIELEERIIRDLRGQIPSFDCIEGCNDCCGVVPWSRWERLQVERNKQVEEEEICPYSSPRGCEVYEHRPIFCRLFGTVRGLECPHGCGPRTLLSPDVERRILGLYLDCVNRTSRDVYNSLKS